MTEHKYEYSGSYRLDREGYVELSFKRPSKVPDEKMLIEHLSGLIELLEQAAKPLFAKKWGKALTCLSNTRASLTYMKFLLLLISRGDEESRKNLFHEFCRNSVWEELRKNVPENRSQVDQTVDAFENYFLPELVVPKN